MEEMPEAIMNRDVDSNNGVYEIDSNIQITNKHYIHSINADIVIRQIPSEGLSFQIWLAAAALMSFLDFHFSDIDLRERMDSTRLNHHLRILELGSGTGIVGISAAALLHANVTLTDLPSVIPNLCFNVEANSALLAARGGSAAAATLRWGCEDDIEGISCDFDVLLASDVVYHDHLYDPLLRTLKYFLEAKTKPFLVMTHLRRWKKDSCFFRKARRMFDVRRLHEDNPMPGCRVGVVVYQFCGRFDVSNQEGGSAV